MALFTTVCAAILIKLQVDVITSPPASVASLYIEGMHEFRRLATNLAQEFNASGVSTAVTNAYYDFYAANSWADICQMYECVR
jgi:hypothetical protein